MDRKPYRPVALALLVLLLPLAVGHAGVVPSAEEYDDCEADFIAYTGADAYQFSPLHEGELGSVRLFAILSFQRAAAAGDWGLALWQLDIRPAGGGATVFMREGVAAIDDPRGATLVEQWWDGRDTRGAVVKDGRYQYTYRARFLPHRLGAKGATSYALAKEIPGVVEAQATTDELVVDLALAPQQAAALRFSADKTVCQVQQNTPLEPSFPYNFYYGSTHAHSNYSDGGQPTTACTSGNAYGSGTFDPASVYGYARFTAGLDFWVINEHNHLINDSVTNNNGPVSESKVRQRYQDGRAAAAAATVDGSFVAIYGMEWGVTTNADQGHVTLLETPSLFGWETCTNCNGGTAECTPGTNCYFDVFTPKRYGYRTLYQRSVENPSIAGPLGILAHPGAGNFDGFAFDANASAALQGIAVRSGLAFSTTESCADANVGATDYSVRWREALNLGFRLGPVADHDSHCNNYGQGLPTRTVYLLPNAIAPVLTKSAMLEAHHGRHFFASEDPNAQLVLATADGAHIMGDVFSVGAATTVRGAVYDPNGDAVSNLELWRGQVGAGTLSTPYLTFANQASFSVNESPAAGTYYYFVHAVQADGHDLWSAPMWITYSGGSGCSDATAPSVAITAPLAGATIACADTLVQVAASDATGIASVEVQVDGGAWSAAALNATSGFYERAWASSTATSGAHSIAARATDASCGANLGAAAPVAVSVDNSACTGGGGAQDVSGWRLTQANAAGTFTLPAATSIPAGGYLIVARSATRAAFETFWGVSLGASVVFVDSAGALPIVNGDESFTLADAASAVVDGPTVNMATAAGQSLRRVDPCQAAGLAASWTVGASTTADPGTGAGAGCGHGVVINEFSDALGTGNYVYEFVELHFDAPAGGGDTQAPTTAITAPFSGATVSGVVTVTASASDDVGVASVEFLLDGALVASDSTAPYSWSWSSTTAANGSHSLSSKAYDAAGNVGSSPAVSVTTANDTTPPTVALTAPAASASLSGLVSVTATASDNVGVASVELLVDGVSAGVDTTSPYAWSWDTAGATNGSHSLTARALDTSGNTTTSTAVGVTVTNGTDVSGWRLVQATSALTYYLPAGTTIPGNGYLIVGRNASRAAFETFWGVSLGASVVYVNALNAMPQINGSESYTLYNAAGTKIDGKTISMSSAGGQSVRRKDPCNAPGTAASWTVGASTTGNPGSGAGAGCAKGVVINELSDATGTGNYIYEFVELHNDR